MLGQPISMLIPQVLGFRLTGTMLEGATATDLVLTITERLRKHGVVGKFVEFFGAGPRAPDDRRSRDARQHVPRVRRDDRDLPDRRDDARLPAAHRPRRRRTSQLVEAYAKAQGLFRTAGDPDPIYSETIELDLATVEPSLAGPEAAAGSRVAEAGEERLPDGAAVDDGVVVEEGRRSGGVGARVGDRPVRRGGVAVAEMPDRRHRQLDHGAVVIAAITSCTNTSNPSVMIGAGLLAKKAVERGLTRKPWVKTSLAPGSKVVTDYLRKAGLDAVSRSARLQPRRLRLHDLHRQQRAAARRGLGRSRGAEPRRRVGAERQPQLRRAHPAAGARELPRVAAARRRLRARRADDDRSDHRAARRRTRRASRCTCASIWPTEREIQETMLQRGHVGDVPRAVRGRLQRRRALAGAAGADRRPLRVGRGLDLHPQPAVLRRHHAAAGAARRTSPARACSRCSATASRPITSRRPARSRRTARRASI